MRPDPLVTDPDLGRGMTGIRSVAEVCRRNSALLIVHKGVRGMCERKFRLLVSAVLLLGIGEISPACAWNGGEQGRTEPTPAHSGPAMNHDGFAMRHSGVRGDVRLRRLNRSQYSLPILGWPYAPFLDTAGFPVENETPVGPEVIILSNSPPAGSAPAAPQALADYSYILGCRAIPNGYHCDAPPKEGHSN